MLAYKLKSIIIKYSQISGRSSAWVQRLHGLEDKKCPKWHFLPQEAKFC